jgi:hypothetical protein
MVTKVLCSNEILRLVAITKANRREIALSTLYIYLFHVALYHIFVRILHLGNYPMNFDEISYRQVNLGCADNIRAWHLFHWLCGTKSFLRSLQLFVYSRNFSHFIESESSLPRLWLRQKDDFTTTRVAYSAGPEAVLRHPRYNEGLL